MLSSSPADARPVRTPANSRDSTSMAAFIRVSRSFSTTCMPSSLPRRRRHDRAHGLAENEPLDVAGAREVEHDDRQLVVHAERDGGGVHDAESLIEHLDVAGPLDAPRAR